MVTCTFTKASPPALVASCMRKSWCALKLILLTLQAPSQAQHTTSHRHNTLYTHSQAHTAHALHLAPLYMQMWYSTNNMRGRRSTALENTGSYRLSTREQSLSYSTISPVKITTSTRVMARTDWWNSAVCATGAYRHTIRALSQSWRATSVPVGSRCRQAEAGNWM